MSYHEPHQTSQTCHLAYDLLFHSCCDKQLLDTKIAHFWDTLLDTNIAHHREGPPVMRLLHMLRIKRTLVKLNLLLLFPFSQSLGTNKQPC